MTHSSIWYQKVSEAGAAHGRKVPTFGSERVCAQEGCRTPLSRYNPEDVCAVHSEPSESSPKAV